MRLRIWLRDADGNISSATLRIAPIQNSTILRDSAVSVLGSAIGGIVDASVFRIDVIEDFIVSTSIPIGSGGAPIWRTGRVLFIRADGSFGSFAIPAISSNFAPVDGGPTLGGGVVSGLSFLLGVGVGAVSPVSGIVSVALEYGGNE